MELLDFLSTNGVDISNNGMQRFKDPTLTGFVPLSTLIDALPKTGADSLLYVKVEQGAIMLGGYVRATVYFQCFDAAGQRLWNEEVISGAVNGANTRFGSHGWKSKLTPHIGKPGLLLKQSQVKDSPEAKK
jgi:hypothetical protein